MILLNTTVLVCAVSADHVLRPACRRLLEAHVRGEVQAAKMVEVLQEFTHGRSRRCSREDAVDLARSFAAMLTLISTDAADLDLGLTLYLAHPRLGAFDAMLAAVALNRRIDALVSADQAFSEVPGLRWMDPAASVGSPS
ncbi:MAG TPA: type II toxin-antitoxin system VapC family toxin [Solirubrobacteraceae bacterium]|nr:type II toxin-antitoxin system VapC family toxin [Solirubrobacteraceae bacterium]